MTSTAAAHAGPRPSYSAIYSCIARSRTRPDSRGPGDYSYRIIREFDGQARPPPSAAASPSSQVDLLQLVQLQQLQRVLQPRRPRPFPAGGRAL